MAQLIGEMILSGTPERARLDIVWAPAGTRCPRADSGYLFKIFVGAFPRDYHKCTTAGLKAGHHALCASLADFLVKENTMKFTWRGGTYPLKVLSYSKGGITFVPDWEKIGWPRNGDWGPFASCNWPTGFSGHVIFEAREVPPGIPEPVKPIFKPPTPPAPPVPVVPPEEVDLISRLFITETEVIEGTIRGEARDPAAHGDWVYIVNTTDGRCLKVLKTDVIRVERTTRPLPTAAMKSCPLRECVAYVPEARRLPPVVPPVPPPVPPVVPPPVPLKDILVQYEAAADRPAAEVIATTLKADLVFTPKGYEEYPEFARIPPYSKLVVVGGQKVNTLFKEIVAETGLREIRATDKGYTFIQVGRWEPHDVWLVAGWTTADTIDAAKYIKARGLPTATVRIKTVVPTPPETELHKAWREFAERPDIIAGFGLLPSSTIESFSRVFTGHSYIDDKAAEPRPGDYAAVLLIIAGVTIVAATTGYTVLAAMPAIGTPGVMKGVAGVSGIGAKEIIKTLGIKAAAKTLTKYALRITGSPFFRIATVAGIWGIMLWNFTDPMWWRGVFVKMTGDFKRRFEGLRIDVETKLKQAFNLLHIKPTAATRTEALSLLRTTGPLISELFKMLAGLEIDKAIKELYPEFEEQVKAFVTQYNTLIKEAGGVEDDYLVFEELRIPEPVIATTFPEEFLLEDVMVEDGDTLMWPGHPEAADRIRIIGIDTHEIETAAGKEEAEYLKSLIEHRQVTIKVTKWQGTAEEREKLIDRYGRLLGGVFLGDTDIALAMLEHFGKAILTPTKYQDKYRWIDWDLYKKTATAAAGPAVKEFKINIDSEPSNAKLYIDGTYTGHWTPANQKELKDVIYLLDPGEHVFRATKAGKEASVKATITEGVNPDIILKLGTVGLVEVPPEEVPAPPEEAEIPPVVEFKINILSTPSRGKVHIDDIYLHHLTPTNEIELQRGPYYGIDYFTPGEHVIRVTKGGKAAEKKVTLTEGDNGEIFLKLEVVGLPRTTEEIKADIAAAEGLLETLKAELAAL